MAKRKATSAEKDSAPKCDLASLIARNVLEQNAEAIHNAIRKKLKKGKIPKERADAILGFLENLMKAKMSKAGGECRQDGEKGHGK